MLANNVPTSRPLASGAMRYDVRPGEWSFESSALAETNGLTTKRDDAGTAFVRHVQGGMRVSVNSGVCMGSWGDAGGCADVMVEARVYADAQ